MQTTQKHQTQLRSTQLKQQNIEQSISREQKIEQVKQKQETNVQQNINHKTQKQQHKNLQLHQQIDHNQQQEDDNQSNWTDATKSIAPDDEDDIWVVDDDIINAMQIDSEEEEIQEGQSKEQQQDQQNQQQEIIQKNEQKQRKQKKVKKQQINIEQLQDQFVKGKQSNQNWRVGYHDKFCTTVVVSNDQKIIITGGGDDFVFFFKQVQQKWQKYYEIKHGETVNKIQISHDGRYVVSIAETQIYCTDLTNMETKKLQIQQPSDFVCHKQGGVIATSNQYTVSIYNLKGLQLFTSYNLDLPTSNLRFSQNGKQIVVSCQNKIRIITPKTGQIIKVSGNEFHKQQISAISTSGSYIISGCISGQVYVSSLNKGNIVGKFQNFSGSINSIIIIDNYALISVQGDGVHWCDINKLKKIFHSPKDTSISAMSMLNANILVFADISGQILLVDRRAPLKIIKSFQAGNTVHQLYNKNNNIYAACEDGFVRIFDVKQYIV